MGAEMDEGHDAEKKKSSYAAVVKIVLALAIIALAAYIFLRPGGIRNIADAFIDNLGK
ncbi:hypothetical protein HYU14_04995 [Candidatus Woesearchaeota archaeon]|nr:hypothetical protein [Candidatus Woesearchaeota archaeon]